MKVLRGQEASLESSQSSDRGSSSPLSVLPGLEHPSSGMLRNLGKSWKSMKINKMLLKSMEIGNPFKIYENLWNTMKVQCSSLCAIKNVMFFQVSGVMAPMARLVAWSGRPGHPKWSKSVSKGLFSVSFLYDLLWNNDILSVMVRKSRFLCVFCGFLKGLALDPLATAQSKRSFPRSICHPKLCCLSGNFVYISATLSLETRPKDNQNRAWKQNLRNSVFFLLQLQFW